MASARQMASRGDSERLDQDVTCFKGEDTSPEALKEFCRDKIANFKIPKHIEVWDELPKGATGKILKRAVIDVMVERYAKAEKGAD